MEKTESRKVSFRSLAYFVVIEKGGGILVYKEGPFVEGKHAFDAMQKYAAESVLVIEVIALK